MTRELRLDVITEQIAEFDGKGGESSTLDRSPKMGLNSLLRFRPPW